MAGELKTLHIPLGVHRRVAGRALREGRSIQSLVTEILDGAVGEVREFVVERECRLCGEAGGHKLDCALWRMGG